MEYRRMLMPALVGSLTLLIALPTPTWAQEEVGSEEDPWIVEDETIEEEYVEIVPGSMDSAALEVLLDVQESFDRHGGTLKLAAAGALCRDILRATGVSSRFEMFDDVNSAVGSFAR